MRVTSEGPIKVTKASVEAAWRRRHNDHRLIVRDKDCRGLALVVNATTMRWEFAYRPRGTDPVTGRRWPNRTVTIGNPKSHSPDDARTEANRIKGSAASGADPAAERKAEAEAARRARGSTLGLLAEQYSKALPHRPKARGAGLPSSGYVAEEIAQVRLALADIDATEIPAVSLAEANVRKLLSSGGGSVPYKRFSALSRFLDWAQDAGHVQINVCTQISRQRRPRAPQARSHYLSVLELARLWRAAERLGEAVWRDLSRFLICMPCRRAEAANVDWSHIDVAASEWRQPGKMTKNRDAHRLHLHPLALGVLRERREATGGKGLVFPAPRSGAALTAFENLKRALSEATAVDGNAAVIGWSWHDIRRSFATALGEAGVPETIADAVLNHRQSATRGGVLGTYQKAIRWPEQQRAMEQWNRMLTEAIDGREADTNVVALSARGG